MASINFAAKLNEDGSFVIPEEAIQELGLRPGDEIHIRLDTATEDRSQEEYDRIIAGLLKEAENLKAERGQTSSDPHEVAFGEILKEKYRKQGFKL